MIKEILLCKYGEIVLKGANRKYFEDMLCKEMKKRARSYGNFDIYRAQSTIYIDPKDDMADLDGMFEAASKVFGIVAIARAAVCDKNTFGMKWGYQLPDGKLIFNARSETAAQKAMFADGMRQRRCLVPADSYYEWQKTGQGKKKYEIAPTDVNGFFLAGIYRIEQGRPVFSILTKDPVESIAFIHNRMPVILPKDAMTDWLNPKYNGIEILSSAVSDMRFLAC